MTLQKRMETCKDLTPTGQKLAAYILQNASRLTDATIQSLAEENYLSVSSIHRFCKKIGLTGFKELKTEILRHAEHSPEAPIDINFPFRPDNTCMQVAGHLKKLYDTTLSDIIDYLSEKQLLAVAALLSVAEMIDIYTHAHHVSILISYSGRAFFLPAILEILRQKRSKIVFFGKAGIEKDSDWITVRICGSSTKISPGWMTADYRIPNSYRNNVTV